MANADYTTDALLASIKRRILMASGASVLSDSDLLALADDELRTFLLPFIREVNEEHLIYRYTAAVVSGQQAYAIPAAAAGEALRTVEVTNASGEYIKQDRIEAAQELKVRKGFYIDDEHLYLVPSPVQGATLRLRYWRRPGKLIGVASGVTDPTRFGKIIEGAAGGTSFQMPNTITAISDTTLCQFVEAGPGFRTLHEATPNDISSGDPGYNAVTIDIAFPAGVDLSNCYICLIDESPVPQVPAELHPLLAQQTALTAILSRGAPGGETATMKRDEMKRDLTALLANRTQGSPKHVQNFYAPGWNRYRARRLPP